jgi:hypothetical protein
MNCSRCGVLIKERDPFEFQREVLCEDCYFYQINPPRACDPIAVSAALSIRKQLGQSGTTGLTELQRQIISLVEEKEKITKEEILKTIHIKPEELERQFAILRHCELIRAFKEGKEVYLRKW